MHLSARDGNYLHVCRKLVRASVAYNTRMQFTAFFLRNVPLVSVELPFTGFSIPVHVHMEVKLAVFSGTETYPYSTLEHGDKILACCTSDCEDKVIFFILNTKHLACSKLAKGDWPVLKPSCGVFI